MINSLLHTTLVFFLVASTFATASTKKLLPVFEPQQQGTINSYSFCSLFENDKNLTFATYSNSFIADTSKRATLIQLKDKVSNLNIGFTATENIATNFSSLSPCHIRIKPYINFHYKNFFSLQTNSVLFTKKYNKYYNPLSNFSMLNTYEYPKTKPVDKAKIGNVDFFDSFQEQAFFMFDINGWKIKSGLDNMRLGPGFYQSVMFSGNAGSTYFPYILQKELYNIFNVTTFCAKLSSESQKQISGHRIEWKVKKWLRLGASESAITNGVSDFWTYLNPLQIYYLTNQRSKNDANLLASADFSIMPIKGLIFSGEILNDDIVIFTKGQPSQWGFLLNTAYYKKLKSAKFWIRAEYIYADIYTYTHYTHTNNVTVDYLPMGFSQGPDADEFHIETQVERKDIKYNLHTRFLRKGSGSINNPWEDNTPDYKNLPYITGDIKYTLKIKASVTKKWFNFLNSGFSVNLLKTQLNTKKSTTEIMPEIYLEQIF